MFVVGVLEFRYDEVVLVVVWLYEVIGKLECF